MDENVKIANYCYLIKENLKIMIECTFETESATGLPIYETVLHEITKEKAVEIINFLKIGYQL